MRHLYLSIRHTCAKCNRCNCLFCLSCLKSYIQSQLIKYTIQCPGATCSHIMTLDNIRAVAGEGLFAKHTKHRREPEVNMDLSKEWCPSPTCDTILTTSFSSKVQCEKCKSTFQVINGKLYQPGETLKEVDYLRECPQCSRPIFREGGCALITCVCGKIFCWYCRKSLDNDPFLSHFKKGLCKNKLGCGRFELLRYRLMVVGIHVGSWYIKFNIFSCDWTIFDH